MSRRLSFQSLPFYYGWIIFAITLLIYTFMFGLRYSIGVFFTPIQQEFNWSTAMTASSVTVFFWVYALSAPIVGRLSERIGVRKTVFIGGLLLGGGGTLVSFIQKIWHLYLFWGIIAAIGAAALYIIPTMILSKFFLKKRGRAIGWSSVGVGLGQATLVPIVAIAIEEYGWRTSIRSLGLLVVVITSIIGYVFLREDPESLGLFIDGEKVTSNKDSYLEKEVISKEVDIEPWLAVRTKTFKLIALSYFFAVGGIISILTFVVPHMIRIGVDPIKASGAFGIIGLMSAIGSFLFGFVSDKIGRKATIIFTTAGISFSFLIASILPANLTLLYVWAIIYGLTYGGCPEQYAAIIADHFGSRSNTTIFGFVTLGGGLGGGLFPLIGGWLVDVSGAYYWTILFLASGMLIATLTIFKISPPEGI